ncbi:nicotinamide N-methyltransferase-like [Ambystoma mexicanum]|uniref:nicotinamide N-methyltransferase-like n=1 Tax=Ambystoma mexicanum TaxID=8296 RepID=UPI0037E80101
MASNLSRKEIYEKHFHIGKTFQTYFTSDSHCVDDTLMRMVQNSFNFFASGAVKGDTMIQYGGAFIIPLLYSACDLFKNIIYIDFLDGCCQSARKWINKEPDAIDWSSCSKFLCQPEEDREKVIEKEEKMRSLIKDVIKAELSDDYPVAPKLSSLADCLLTAYCLEIFCHNKESFQIALKQMALLIKLEGCLLINMLLDCTFFKVEKFKFPVLCLSEEYVRQAVTNVGFEIKHCNISPRSKPTLYSEFDYSGCLLLVAYKKRNV